MYCFSYLASLLDGMQELLRVAHALRKVGAKEHEEFDVLHEAIELLQFDVRGEVDAARFQRNPV